MDCSPPGPSVIGISEARAPERESGARSGRTTMQSALPLTARTTVDPRRAPAPAPRTGEARGGEANPVTRSKSCFELLLVKFLHSWEAQNWQEKQTASLH